jgi:hypothetical protein
MLEVLGILMVAVVFVAFLVLISVFLKCDPRAS